MVSRFCAPEVILEVHPKFPDADSRAHYGPPADVYAFAVTVFELATGLEAYAPSDGNRLALWSQVLNGLRPTPLPKQQFGQKFCMLLEDCWHKDADQRPTFREILVGTL